MHPGSRRLAFSEFAGDDGTADPRLVDALESGDHGRLLASLCEVRLLVPVVALLGETAYDENGLKTDKSSDMAVVLLTGRDGRRALLAFSGVLSLRAWQPDARPMPAATTLVATAAVQEGAAAIVLDIAGPHTAVVETEDVRRLAAGHRVVRLEDGGYAWAAPA
jgi:SseB protein N-terminal domain